MNVFCRLHIVILNSDKQITRDDFNENYYHVYHVYHSETHLLRMLVVALSTRFITEITDNRRLDDSDKIFHLYQVKFSV